MFKVPRHVISRLYSGTDGQSTATFHKTPHFRKHLREHNILDNPYPFKMSRQPWKLFFKNKNWKMYTIETGNDIDMLTRTWFCPVTIMKCCPIFFVTINYVSFSKMPLRCLKFCFPICCIFTPRATVHLFNLYKYLDKLWLYGGVYACGNTISTIPCFQSL